MIVLLYIKRRTPQSNWMRSSKTLVPFHSRQSNCLVLFFPSFPFFFSSLSSRALRRLWQWETGDRNHIHCSLSVSHCRHWTRGLRRLFVPVPLSRMWFFFFCWCWFWSSGPAANCGGGWAVLGLCSRWSCQSEWPPPSVPHAAFWASHFEQRTISVTLFFRKPLKRLRSIKLRLFLKKQLGKNMYIFFLIIISIIIVKNTWTLKC